MPETTDIVILQLKIDEGTGKKIPDAKKEVEVLAGSIVGLAKANKELRAERNKLDLTTEAGKKKIAELNAEINKNNQVIKDNSSALEKQRLNVGNYIGALDKLVPGLGATATGFGSMTTAALAFIATPIGAVIGALGLALGALISYFKGSEEGQNRLNRIMNIGGAVMEKVMDIVENLGGALFDAAANPKKAFQELVDFITTNLTNRFKAVAVIIEGVKNLDFKQIVNGTIQLTTGVTNVIGKLQDFGKEVDTQVTDAMRRAEQLSQLQEQLNKQERDITVDRAKIQRDVSRLFVESQQLEGQARLDKINEAIALERKLLAEEKRNADTRLALAKMEVEDDPTIENKQAYAEATAAQYQAEQAFYDGIRRLDKQRLSAQEEVQNEKLKIYEDFLTRQHELYLLEKKDRDESDKAEDDRDKRFLARLKSDKKAREDDAKSSMETSKKEFEFQKAVGEARIGLVDTIGNVLGQLAGKNKALAILGVLVEKAAAIAGLVSNTAIANAKAIAVSPLTFGQPWVGINTATAVASGIGVVAQAAESISQINSSKFAQGGSVKYATIGGRAHSQGGTKFWGEDGTFFEAEKDEGLFIMKKSANTEYLSSLNQKHGGRSWGHRSWYAAQGGQIEARDIARGIRGNDNIARIIVSAITNMPRPVVFVEDIRAGVNNAVSTEARSAPL